MSLNSEHFFLAYFITYWLPYFVHTYFIPLLCDLCFGLVAVLHEQGSVVSRNSYYLLWSQFKRSKLDWLDASDYERDVHTSFKQHFALIQFKFNLISVFLHRKIGTLYHLKFDSHTQSLSTLIINRLKTFCFRSAYPSSYLSPMRPDSPRDFGAI